jgi:hypothetical protein
MRLPFLGAEFEGHVKRTNSDSCGDDEYSSDYSENNRERSCDNIECNEQRNSDSNDRSNNPVDQSHVLHTIPPDMTFGYIAPLPPNYRSVRYVRYKEYSQDKKTRQFKNRLNNAASLIILSMAFVLPEFESLERTLNAMICRLKQRFCGIVYP